MSVHEDDKLLVQKVDNLTLMVQDLNETVTVAFKQFQMVAIHLQKKTDNWQERIESWPFAWPSSKPRDR